MTEAATDFIRPRGRYGVDGDYHLIPAPVAFAGYLLLCLAATVVAGLWLAAGRTLPGLGAAVLAVVLIGAALSVWRFSRRGKFEVWARLLIDLQLRGDERVLDLGCGRGAVLLAAAKLVPRGMRCRSGHLAGRPDRQLRAGNLGECRCRRRRRPGRTAHPGHDRSRVPRRVLRSHRQQPCDPQPAEQRRAAVSDRRSRAGVASGRAGRDR